MIIQLIKSQPKEISTVYIQAILMPNGELISEGKSMGYYRTKSLETCIWEERK
jgi:hypothetical protein